MDASAILLLLLLLITLHDMSLRSIRNCMIQVTNDLKGNQLKRATEDPSLPICWKGSKSFKTVNDVKNYFKPLALRFKKVKNSQMLIPPEGYLIVTVSTF